LLLAFGLLGANGAKRLEYLNSIQSLLKELEERLAASNEQFFGGM